MSSTLLDTNRPRWIIVVEASRSDVHSRLGRTFQRAPWVEVILDRRRGERRRREEPPEAERRRGDRRRQENDRTRVPDYRLAYHGDGHAVFEATWPAEVKCPQCGSLVRFEMPRFAEPPARLDLIVRHEPVPPEQVRHFVELQSYTSIGRPLLATRVTGRAASEPR